MDALVEFVASKLTFVHPRTQGCALDTTLTALELCEPILMNFNTINSLINGLIKNCIIFRIMDLYVPHNFPFFPTSYQKP